MKVTKQREGVYGCSVWRATIEDGSAVGWAKDGTTEPPGDQIRIDVSAPTKRELDALVGLVKAWLKKNPRRYAAIERECRKRWAKEDAKS